MRIMVTGSSGFIGRALAAEIARCGHELIPFDKPRDVRDFTAVDAENVDAIINLAGMLGTPELFGSEAKAAEVNILGAIRVFDVARELGIPMVQIGTAHKGQPNPYAITKGCAEDLALSRARYMGQEISVVRAYHVFGPGQSVGAPHGDAKVRKFFPTFACNAITALPIKLAGGGGQLIDPVYVDDCAKVLVQAIGGPYGKVIEAGCGVEVDVRSVAEYILDYAQSDSEIVSAAPRDGEPANASVVASEPQCANVWPYKAAETVDWYRDWLKKRAMHRID
jgi:nucleoside-diphosphate-sugar epimerase